MFFAIISRKVAGNPEPGLVLSYHLMAKHAFIRAAGVIGLPDKYFKTLIVLEKISHNSIATN